MAFTKYASFEAAQVLDVKGSPERAHTASLAKLADFADYRTDDGFLYCRIRAISSRVNKNHDGWPSVELAGGQDLFDRFASQAKTASFSAAASPEAKYGYSTFLGKPIFIDHNNTDPSRARGVIVDARLHVDDHKTASELDPYYASPDIDESHLPPTWVELLLEVDAKSFPKLAQAIIEGSQDPHKGIDGFSMGCDCERSVCNICKNSATSPEEYCQHIRMKGAHFNVNDSKTGKRTSRRSYENCYGVKFFEISAVFDPADETALLRELIHKEGASAFPPSAIDTEEFPASGQMACPGCSGVGCGACGNTGAIQVPHPGMDAGPVQPIMVTPGVTSPQGAPETSPMEGYQGLRPQGNSQMKLSQEMLAAMGAQDFRMLADMIATSPVENRQALAEHAGNYLAQTNPRFDKERFIQAAMGTPQTGRDQVGGGQSDYPVPEVPVGHQLPGITTGKVGSDPTGEQGEFPCPNCGGLCNGDWCFNCNTSPGWPNARTKLYDENMPFGGTQIPSTYPPQSTSKVAQNPAPQSTLLALPQEVDTLRTEEICPVCGSTMDDETCEVCGYIEPPEGFDNPDLTKAEEDRSGPEESEGPQPEGQGQQQPQFQDQGQQAQGQTPSNPLMSSKVKSDMSWDVRTPSRVTSNNSDVLVPNKGPATDEPNEEVLIDPKAPVTSSVNTAKDFIAVAGAYPSRRQMSTHTADAASGAPAVATPDVNVDVEGVGGVDEPSNEQASKADAQVDTLGVGGTGVEGVAADSTVSVDQGDEHSKNIEEIPTKTWSGTGGSGVETQRSPVSPQPFPATEDGVKASNWQVTALESQPFPRPEDAPYSDGEAAVQGVQPADPVGVADERVNLFDPTTTPENNSGPTTTWSGTDGNGVLRQQEPTTNETLEGSDGVKRSHLLASFQLADLEIKLGMLDEANKYQRVGELEKVPFADVTASLKYAEKVRTAARSGRLGGSSKTSKRLPVMGRSSAVEEPQAPETDNIPAEALFLK